MKKLFLYLDNGIYFYLFWYKVKLIIFIRHAIGSNDQPLKRGKIRVLFSKMNKKSSKQFFDYSFDWKIVHNQRCQKIYVTTFKKKLNLCGVEKTLFRMNVFYYC